MVPPRPAVRRLACATLGVALLVASGAAADEPMRAVLRVTGEGDDALLARVRGQAADLDVTLDTQATPAVEPTLAGQLAEADALAAEHEARVVVWFTAIPGSPGLLVCVAEPKGGRVLLRRVGRDQAGGPPTSATLEEAALIVRSALRALAAGGTIGVERRTLAPRTAEPKPPVPRPRRQRPPRVVIAAVGGLGLQAGTDGADGDAAAATWLGLRVRAFEARVEAAFGVPTDTPTPYGTLHIARHAVTLGASVALVRRARWDLAAGARAGALLYVRQTRAPAPELVASTTGLEGAPLLGLELRLRWRPTADRWALVGAAGVDTVLGAPAFGFSGAGGFVSYLTPATLQPRAFLGLEFSSRSF